LTISSQFLVLSSQLGACSERSRTIVGCRLSVVRFILRSFSVGVFFLLFLSSWAQEKNTSLKFPLYLYEKNLKADALLELNNFQKKNVQSDSVNFILGWIYEDLSQNDSAIACYKRISPGSPCYINALCRTAYLKALNNNSSLDALALFNESYPELNLKNKLDDYEKSFSQIKRRSPWIAGSLSAIVPGLGKVYAGKPKQGLLSLIPLAALALQAYEGYGDKGLKSGRFWIYGSIFTIFYIGNIYGSALSVKIVKQEKYDEVENAILVDLRLSLQQVMGR
jgi:hypothetical protein